MINILFSRLCILACGILYPAYISFKIVRANMIDDYVKWLMYWIVFATFTSIQAFSDIFFAWCPFYYELKVIFILWLLPTTANGSSLIYKLCIHPLLKKHETRIDYHLRKMSEKGEILVLEYIKEAVFYIAKIITDIINRNFPNGVTSLLANNNLPRSLVQNSQNVIIEDIVEIQQMSKKLQKPRKGSANTSRNKESETGENSQGRSRRTRQNKKEAD